MQIRWHCASHCWLLAGNLINLCALLLGLAGVLAGGVGGWCGSSPAHSSTLRRLICPVSAPFVSVHNQWHVAHGVVTHLYRYSLDLGLPVCPSAHVPLVLDGIALLIAFLSPHLVASHHISAGVRH